MNLSEFLKSHSKQILKSCEGIQQLQLIPLELFIRQIVLLSVELDPRPEHNLNLRNHYFFRVFRVHFGFFGFGLFGSGYFGFGFGSGRV